MADPLDPDLEWSFAMVGRFLFYWGAMESQLNNIVGSILKLSYPQSEIVTRNIGLHDKLAIVGALLDALNLPDQKKRKHRAAVARISKLSADRNICAHEWFGPGDAPKTVMFLRYTVRGRFNPNSVEWSEADFDRKINAIEAIRSDLADLHSDAKVAVHNRDVMLKTFESIDRFASKGIVYRQSRPPLTPRG